MKRGGGKGRGAGRAGEQASPRTQLLLPPPPSSHKTPYPATRDIFTPCGRVLGMGEVRKGSRVETLPTGPGNWILEPGLHSGARQLFPELMKQHGGRFPQGGARVRRGRDIDLGGIRIYIRLGWAYGRLPVTLGWELAWSGTLWGRRAGGETGPLGA